MLQWKRILLKNEKKTFAIIGGGITGCTAALYINKLGHNVILYEKSDKLGGVLRT